MKWFTSALLAPCLMLASGCGTSNEDRPEVVTASTPAALSVPAASVTAPSPDSNTPASPVAHIYHRNPALSEGQNDPIVQGYELTVPADQNGLTASSLPGGFTWQMPTQSSVYGTASAPTMNDIVQGVIGDCYFDASLGALLNTPNGASVISMMIGEGGLTGTHTVTFYEPASTTTVTVNDAQLKDIDGDTVGNQIGDSNGNWPQLLEKAYVIYAARTADANANEQYPIAAIDDHGATEGTGVATIKAALFALTGRTSTNLKIASTSEADIKAALAKAPNVATVANTATPDPQTGLSAPHVYTVLSYDSASDTVVLRDPHGTNNAAQANADGHGMFSVSYAAFQNHVDAVTTLSP